ncbi:MAG: phosphoribosylformylglycinamidine synthase subunit PurS [Halobacteriota archaeon]
MNYRATVRVALKDGVLDPEARTIEHSLGRLGFEVSEMQRAEEYDFVLDAADEAEARDTAEEMCERLLANPVIHDYTVEVTEA